MILGIDAGTSAVKLAVLDGETICATYYQPNRIDTAHTLRLALERSGILSLPISHVALTGLNSARCRAESMKLPQCTVSELDAIGCGGCFLSGKDNALVVNMGTGTTFVLAQNGRYTHLGGTGIGGGTLMGLGRGLLGVNTPDELFQLADHGDVGQVDLRIGDLFAGSETLDPTLTSSNLAKASPGSTQADWAAGLLNLVLECTGTMAMLACGAHQVSDVVLLGALTQLPQAKERFQVFTQFYRPNYFIAPQADCATAIGTALLAKENNTWI